MDSTFTRRRFLAGTALGMVFLGVARKAKAVMPGAGENRVWIGYTEFRTNLPSRHANIVTMRACIVRDDGTERRALAEELAREPNAWTQFAGWSPDGSRTIIGRGWESPENGAWEEEHKTFRFSEGWLYDMYLYEMATGTLTNVTAPERVSAYNTGLFFMPGNSGKLGFQALINGNSHPFTMDLDGRNKKDISAGGEGCTYGFNASPDGTRVAYHKDYQVFIANADGSYPVKVETGNPFNFSPQWSPDGQWVLFVSGEHYNCHPYIARKDGSGVRKIADRRGYRGSVEFLDVYDFHSGSSDVPVWGADSKSVYFTAQVSDSVELMRASLEGKVDALTKSPPRTLNYQPKVSPKGDRVIFGSNRTGTRQLYVVRADGTDMRPLTHVKPSHGAMWPCWQA